MPTLTKAFLEFIRKAKIKRDAPPPLPPFTVDADEPGFVDKAKPLHEGVAAASGHEHFIIGNGTDKPFVIPTDKLDKFETAQEAPLDTEKESDFRDYCVVVATEHNFPPVRCFTVNARSNTEALGHVFMFLFNRGASITHWNIDPADNMQPYEKFNSKDVGVHPHIVSHDRHALKGLKEL